MDSKALAMLGVLSAVNAALRPLGAGLAGIETVFFLLVLAGRVFGPGFGFVLGCTSVFASALLTAGVGPWLPFQMMASAWIGLGAGLLPRRVSGRAEIAMLVVYGIFAAYFFGFVMNLWFWPFAVGPAPTCRSWPATRCSTTCSASWSTRDDLEPRLGHRSCHHQHPRHPGLRPGRLATLRRASAARPSGAVSFGAPPEPCGGRAPPGDPALKPNAPRPTRVTRRPGFYQARGFVPLEEIVDFWPEDRCCRSSRRSDVYLRTRRSRGAQVVDALGLAERALEAVRLADLDVDRDADVVLDERDERRRQGRTGASAAVPASCASTRTVSSSIRPGRVSTQT